MSIDYNPSTAVPRKVLIIAGNPAISSVTGWPVGFWASELIHPYHAFVEAGYEVSIASPEGGKLVVDAYSDPDDASGYSSHDLISRGFLSSSTHKALIENSLKLANIKSTDFDAIFLVGGQSPMFTFYDNAALHRFVAESYELGKIVAVVCHATCILLKTKLSDGNLLVKGKTWTGFANSEEDFADSFVGKRLQPFRIEEEARKINDTNFIVQNKFREFAVRDGNLITGQQQYSGTAAAALVTAALGR